MANHKSALKRIRQTAKKAAHNRYYHKTTRNAVRKLRAANSQDVVVFGCIKSDVHEMWPPRLKRMLKRRK
mgnify:CR=1 FL=1